MPLLSISLRTPCSVVCSLTSSCGAAAGLSLGEYTALVFAGALSFEDALTVVKVRAEAMQQCAESKLVSCSGNRALLAQLFPCSPLLMLLAAAAQC